MGSRATPPVLRGPLLLGTPVNQGHPGPGSQVDLPGREPDRTQPSPSTSKVRPETPTGTEAACTRVAAGLTIQRREAGRSEGLSGRPGWAAAPKEQARAGVAATLSHLITYTYSF